MNQSSTLYDFDRADPEITLLRDARRPTMFSMSSLTMVSVIRRTSVIESFNLALSFFCKLETKIISFSTCSMHQIVLVYVQELTSSW